MPYIAKKDKGLIDRAYWSIEQMADEFGLATSALRYWETQFPNLKPKRDQRNPRRDRIYTRKDRAEILKIYNLLKVEGMTIKGAKRRLKLLKGKLSNTYLD